MKLAAIAAFALVGFAVAQTVQQIPVREVRVTGEVPAEWWVYEHVFGGQPYVVPNNRRFVLTAIVNDIADIQEDGIGAWTKVHLARPGVQANGTRVVFEPGTVLSASSVADLWGYLEPVR